MRNAGAYCAVPEIVFAYRDLTCIAKPPLHFFPAQLYFARYAAMTSCTADKLKWTEAPLVTPAQKYRQALTDLLGNEREILRLEQRWKKNSKKWIKAATRVQSFVRFVCARQRVAELRAQADIDRRKRARIANAIDALRRRRFDEAAIEASEALNLDHKCFEGYRVMGHVYLAKQEHSKAVSQFTESIRLDVKHLECRLGRARCHGVLGNWQEAVDDLVYLMDIDAQTSTYWFFRGLIRSKLRQWQGAVSDFTKCVELGDTSATAWLRRGMAEASSQRWDEAVVSFSRSLECNEIDLSAYSLRGRTFCCLRKWEEAELDFKKVLEINPDNEEANAGLAIINIPHLPLPLTDA